jgi:dTMP kinase
MVTDFEPSRTEPARPRRLRTVALVGIDGSGKTTQAHRLAGDLAAAGLPATYRRNAGGRRWFGRLATALGRTDAEHLLGRRGILLIESVLRWLAIARTLLRQLFTRDIAVMDRYAVCQYASLRSHAAAPRPAEPTRAERFARWAYRVFPAPDVTFLLAVDPAVAYERIESRGYDHESMEYLSAATAAYRALPEYRSFVVVDADGTPDQVSAAIRAHLAAWLPATPASAVEPPVWSAPAVPVPRSVERVRAARPLHLTDGAAAGPAGQPAPAAQGAHAILLSAGPSTAGASTVG